MILGKKSKIKYYKKILLIILFLVLSNLSVQAQEKRDNIIGQTYLISSSILGEEREIQVFLPENYEASKKAFPVLYLLDGQRLFLHGVSLLQSFSQFELSPEFIVIGINNKYPQRFGHFSRGGDKFSDFIETELIPFVENTFRISNEKILFGWEYAGSFALKIMIERPDLFRGYILASPFPLDNRVTALQKILSSQKLSDKSLFFSVSPNEDVVNKGTERLDSLLKSEDNVHLKWTYLNLENEEHRSTPYSTLYHGLKKHFHYYPEFQVDNLEEFMEAGGIEFARAYNQKRAEEYGFSPELSSWTKFTMIRSAMRADHYAQFISFMNEFKEDTFIKGLRGSRPYSIAEFYEKNRNFEGAIEIYKMLAQKEPASARPLNNLGRVYTTLNNETEAAKYFQMAKEIANN